MKSLHASQISLRNETQKHPFSLQHRSACLSHRTQTELPELNLYVICMTHENGNKTLMITLHTLSWGEPQGTVVERYDRRSSGEQEANVSIEKAVKVNNVHFAVDKPFVPRRGADYLLLTIIWKAALGSLEMRRTSCCRDLEKGLSDWRWYHG